MDRNTILQKGLNLMLPQFDINTEDINFEVVTQPSKTYKDTGEIITGYVNNIEAI